MATIRSTNPSPEHDVLKTVEFYEKRFGAKGSGSPTTRMAGRRPSLTSAELLFWSARSHPAIRQACTTSASARRTRNSVKTEVAASLHSGAQTDQAGLQMSFLTAPDGESIELQEGQFMRVLLIARQPVNA